MAEAPRPEDKLLKAIHSVDTCDYPGCHYKIMSAEAYDRHLEKEHPADTWK